MKIDENGVFSFETRIASTDCDSFYQATTVHYFDLVQEVSGTHTLTKGCAIPQINEMNLTWMIIRTDMEINRYATWGETLTVYTKPLPADGFYCPRIVWAVDVDGKTLFSAKSLWCVLDLNTHHPANPEIVKDWLLLTPEGAFKLPRRIAKPDDEAGRRSVKSAVSWSDCDWNGHMNNIAYLNHITAAIEPEVRNEALISHIDIKWAKEVKFGDDLTVSIVRDISGLNYATIMKNLPDGSEELASEASFEMKPRSEMARPWSVPKDLPRF